MAPCSGMSLLSAISKKEPISGLAVYPLCNPGPEDSTRGNTSRIALPSGRMCATHHFRARVRAERHDSCGSKPSSHPSFSHLFSPSSPLDGAGPRGTEPHWTHGQTAPASLACVHPKPVASGPDRTEHRHDGHVSQSGRRGGGRLRIAPCEGDLRRCRGKGGRERLHASRHGPSKRAH